MVKRKEPEVTREIFIMASALLALDDLKNKGFLGGGPDIEIDILGLTRLVERGKTKGFPAPTQSELGVAVGSIERL